MLNTETLMGFVATAQPEAAKHFYGETLGLTLLEDSPFALVFAVKGSTLRVQKLGAHSPVPFTVLGWAVENIEAVVQALTARGVTFMRVEGLPQDALGIWHTPDGAKVAWFHDPDGNTLSVSEHPAKP